MRFTAQLLIIDHSKSAFHRRTLAMSNSDNSQTGSSPSKVKSKSSKSTSTLKRKKASKDENNPRKKPAVSQSSTHEREAKACDNTKESGINEAFAMMDGRLLSDYLAQKTRDFEKHLSVVELEDKYIPGLSLNLSTQFASSLRRKSFLKRFLADWLWGC